MAAQPARFKAGVLAIAVHVAFLIVLIFGVKWQTKAPAPVQVELWDALPHAAKPAPTRVTPPRPVVEPEPEPAPPPKPVAKPKPIPKPEPKIREAIKEPDKADIQRKIDEKKEKQARLKEEKLKQEEIKKEKAEQQARLLKEETLRREQEIKKEAQKKEQLKKQEQLRQAELARLQREAQDATSQRQARRAATASKAALDGYVEKIRNKILDKVNNQACGEGNPQAVFSVVLMPTGQLLQDPRLMKSTGLPACDSAIERAIRLAQPLPMPQERELYNQLRDLELKFRPNEQR